jgi:hypothetical protein
VPTPVLSVRDFPVVASLPGFCLAAAFDYAVVGRPCCPDLIFVLPSLEFLTASGAWF